MEQIQLSRIYLCKEVAERERTIEKGRESFQPPSSPSRSSINQVRILPLTRSRIIPGILVGHLARRPRIEFIQHTLGNPVEQFLGVDAEEVPGDVQRLVNTPGLVGGLTDEGALEFVEEFERELILWGQSFFSDDCFHGGCLGDYVLAIVCPFRVLLDRED